MNSTSGNLQDNINSIFFIIIYVPVNIIFMLLAAVMFSVSNRLLHLRFPPIVVAVAAAVFVFVFMCSYLGSVANQGGWINFGVTPTMFYTTTAIINLIVLILMLAISGINRLIFKNQDAAAFVFAKPQLIATIIYAILTGCFAVQPFIRKGGEYLAEKRDEKALVALKEMIDNNNVKEFEEACVDSNLCEKTLLGEKDNLFKYAVAHNKPEIVHLLLKAKPQLFSYTLNWDVNTPEMLQQLIDDGMKANKAVDILTKLNDTSLVKLAVEKYKPEFDTLVSFITRNLIEHNNNALLDYLVQHGLTKYRNQTSETIFDFVRQNDSEAVTLLINKGFAIDTADKGMIHFAIYNRNLPLLKFLFTYPFDVNDINDEYTNVENTIIGNNPEIFDYLLTLHPDVTTLHYTKLNGETNALLIAEKYKQTEMLEKLKKYVK